MVAATVITALAHTSLVPGNELDRTHGLDWYDSKARFYDSILLRTNSMDKKAGDYTWLSPYLWCAANPIRFTDPSGEEVENNNGIEFNLKLHDIRDYIGKEFREFYNIIRNDKLHTFVI